MPQQEDLFHESDNAHRARRAPGGSCTVYLARKPTLAVTAIASRHHTLTRPLSHPHSIHISDVTGRNTQTKVSRRGKKTQKSFLPQYSHTHNVMYVERVIDCSQHDRRGTKSTVFVLCQSALLSSTEANARPRQSVTAN